MLYKVLLDMKLSFEFGFLNLLCDKESEKIPLNRSVIDRCCGGD